LGGNYVVLGFYQINTMNGMAVIVVDIAVSEMFGSCVDTQLLPL